MLSASARGALVSDTALLIVMVILVNYLAYLRKMTRYNPTRGGMIFALRDHTHHSSSH